MDTLPELPTLDSLEQPALPVKKTVLRPLPRPVETSTEIEPVVIAPPIIASRKVLECETLTSTADNRIDPFKPTAATTTASAATSSKRLLSLDAYRGFIMLLMASGGLGIKQIAEATKSDPDSMLAKLAPLVEHVKWAGGVPWDMIQPAFMFMVGVAMPFSYAKRLEQGGSSWGLFFHALIRAVVLVALGVLCASSTKDSTNWAFTNVLAQIGLGYIFLFMLWRMGTVAQVLGTIGILGGYYAYFANAPLLTPPSSAYSDGVLQGFFAHWSMNANAAASFDQWFLNLFPRSAPFEFADGGYQTLNFIPSIATMCLGLMAGRFLRTDRSHGMKVVMLVIAGAVLVLLGLAAGESLCPIVKRIWTPSWVLYSGGIVTLVLAAFYLEVEVLRMRWLAWPFAIVGMNSILVYLMSQFSKGWIKDRLHQHLQHVPGLFQGPYLPMIESGLVLGVFWLICLWLYRQRAFIRI